MWAIFVNALEMSSQCYRKTTMLQNIKKIPILKYSRKTEVSLCWDTGTLVDKAQAMSLAFHKEK